MKHIPERCPLCNSVHLETQCPMADKKPAKHDATHHVVITTKGFPEPKRRWSENRGRSTN